MVNLDFLEDQNEMRTFTLAAGMIALSILALIALALTGASLIFYILIILSIASGFYLSYSLSRPKQARSTASRTSGRKTSK